MDVFSTEQLIGVVESLVRPQSSLLDRYFGTVRTFDTEAVDVDVVPGKRKVAPLVSPVREGKVIESDGYTTRTIKQAYVKMKVPFDPATKPFTRAVGERIGGDLTPQQRMDLALARDLEMLIGMVIRRKELMASEALRTAKLVLSGEAYPTVNIDFLRAAGNLIADLTTTARWGDSAPNIPKNLKTWARVALKASAVYPRDVIMGSAALDAFFEDSKVEKRILQLNASGTQIAREALSTEGLQSFGTFDGFNVFGYDGWYDDPTTGTATEIFPAKAVLLASPLVEGIQLQGAIRDTQALRPAEFFPKMWDEPDPSLRWLMVQSAPLVAPLRPDSTVYIANVIDA